MQLWAKHVENPFILFGQISTVLYFSYFILILPFVSLIENTLIQIRGKSTNSPTSTFPVYFLKNKSFKFNFSVLKEKYNFIVIDKIKFNFSVLKAKLKIFGVDFWVCFALLIFSLDIYVLL